MKNLHYEVNGALLQNGTGDEAQVGDQVKLFLDTEADPDFPEFILGVIQTPISKIACDTRTSYIISYNEADLDGAALLIRQSNVVDVEVISAVDALADIVVGQLPLNGFTSPPTQGITEGRIGQHYIATIFGKKYTWICVSESPFTWQAVTSGLMFNTTLNQWRMTYLVGNAGEESLYTDAL